MSGAFAGWTETKTVTVVTKTVVNHRVSESESDKTVDISLQPMPPERVARKPEEQRSWKWWSLWIREGRQSLKIDDIITVDGTPYRIAVVSDWSAAQYQNYEAVEGYSG